MSETSSVLLENGKLKNELAIFLGKCPVCDSRNIKYLFKFQGFNYRKCKNCSFVFVDPRPNDKGCNIWYNSDYYNTALEIEHYKNKKLDPYHSESLNKNHFLTAVKILEKQNFSKNFSILDLGCGGGSFLAYIRDTYGFRNLLGIDLNSRAVDFARDFRDLNVIKMDAKELDEKKRFDLIISTENIEHVNDVNAYLDTINKLTKDKGYLLLSTPHNDRWATKLYGIFGDHFCAPNHLNYFNYSSLSMLLNNYNYSIIDSFIDNTMSKFDFYTFLKSKIFTRDQVVALPPYEAFFKKPIWKFIKNRNKLVGLKKSENNFSENEIISSQKNRSFSSLLKHQIRKLSNLINWKFETHMIILARKN